MSSRSTRGNLRKPESSRHPWILIAKMTGSYASTLCFVSAQNNSTPTLSIESGNPDMMLASFYSLGKHDRLRLAVIFEKEVDPFDALTSMFRVVVEFFTASATVVRKLLAVPESSLSDSVFVREGGLHDLLALVASLLK